MTREQKYKAFQALHQRPEAFVIPNPWNAGTAKILAALGFEALATTSAGYAFSIGHSDSAVELTRLQLRGDAIPSSEVANYMTQPNEIFDIEHYKTFADIVGVQPAKKLVSLFTVALP
jgi:hypothetical protein